MNSTYHGTSDSGAIAKFTFNGTGVWFYGAKKPDYGSLILVVDDDVAAYVNATASDTELGQFLVGASDLKMGEHVVSVMNGGTGAIDLDAIVYETVNQAQPKAVAHGIIAQSPSSDSSAANTQTSSVNTSSAGGPSATPNAITTDSGDSSSGQDAASQSPAASPNADPNEPPATTQADTTPQPSDQATQSAAAPAAVTASPNAVSTGSSTSSENDTTKQPIASPNAVRPQTGQAEHSGPTIAGTSKPHRGLPIGAIIGIAIGCAVLLLLITAFIFLFMRRRRRLRARRRITNLPSPILPLQDPDTEFGYFFRGQGAMSEKREQYLGQSSSRFSRDSGATLQGSYSGPYKEKDVTEMPTPLPPAPAYMGRGSSYTTNTATLNGPVEDGTDIADMYSQMDPGIPTRPPRPPDLRLSV
ncbi:hypothetical protein ONZ51_g8939 [Trametes cubensis]|uniref:Mid2 domain-containing protein n=1 Tax=Trametes cubensis TaxID=1111947 RepID=A0AAD7X7R4_9APHY|nr:hypothetical protein ONZ51_g8939 [Trametes cubensis]